MSVSIGVDGGVEVGADGTGAGSTVCVGTGMFTPGGGVTTGEGSVANADGSPFDGTIGASDDGVGEGVGDGFSAGGVAGAVAVSESGMDGWVVALLGR